MKWLLRILDDLKRGENLDAYVALVLAIFLNIFGVVSILPPDWTSSLTNLVLALLIVNILGNRYRLDTITEKVPESRGGVLLNEFPSCLKGDFSRAKELWLFGVSLFNVMELNYSLFNDKLTNEKFYLRILVVNPDPDDHALSMAAMRSVSIDAEGERMRTNSTISLAMKLRKTAPGQVEVRVINNPLSYQGFMIDPCTPHGVIYIRHYGFKTKLGEEPHLTIAAANKKWFDFYHGEMTNLWNAGIEYKENV